MATVQSLINEVKSVVDVTDDEALAVFLRRYDQLVVRGEADQVSQSYTSIAGVSTFDLPDRAVEVKYVDVAGLPYDKGRYRDWAIGQQGGLAIDGAGLFMPGVERGTFNIWPPPNESGLEVFMYATAHPQPVALASDLALLVCDTDFQEPLIQGVCATFLARIGEGDPASLEASFSAGCEEQRMRSRRRLKGTGAVQIRVTDINA